MTDVLTTHRQPSKTLNVALLVGAFALSQGAMFVVQSWLVAHDQVALVGLFGSLFTFATLALSVIDWGGVVVLARHELSESPREGDGFFWSLSIVRATVAVAVVAMCLVVYAVDPVGFSGNYGLAATPGLMLGAVNMAGLLDGRHRSGISGATAYLPALGSALTLTFTPGLPVAVQGIALGTAFSLGVAVSLLLQVIVLRRLGRLPRFERCGWSATVSAGRQGGLVLLTLLPSYVSYRIQVAIAVWLLGTEATGLFVYAKQIVNGIQQGVGFIRRAEFPRLVVRLQTPVPLTGVVRLQAAGIVVGMVGTLVLMVAGIGVGILRTDSLGTAGVLLAYFAPAVITAAVYGALNQAYVANNRSGTTATVTNLNLLLLAGLTAVAVAWTGTIGFAIAECLVNAIGIAALIGLWRANSTIAAAERR